MLKIRRNDVLVGMLTALLKLTTKDPRLRELVERARTEGLAHWFRPNVQEKPHMPLCDGVRRVRAGEEFLADLRRELAIHGYTTETRRG